MMKIHIGIPTLRLPSAITLLFFFGLLGSKTLILKTDIQKQKAQQNWNLQNTIINHQKRWDFNSTFHP